MLYTRKGDDGKTRTFSLVKKGRVSKSSCETESLGVLDELNSFLGIIKVKGQKEKWKIEKKKLPEIISWLQNCLFIVQAEVAGSNKTITRTKVLEMEMMIDNIEKQLPLIKTFFVSGGTELSALIDYSRTLSRKVERQIIRSVEDGSVEIGGTTLAFLNRTSSLLYALARLTNHKSGISEIAPTY
ncbi:MAG: cob(I)yrinic acid a,c-diamide adenosyltransferase [Candidatus Paceibacterota bacterium]|jgi:cob(I)alamin adenosyltransferase